MTTTIDHERCPDCGMLLPQHGQDGPTHRYIGASPGCWALFSSLNAGEPPLASSRLGTLIFDAYTAQHHGTPSPQAIQSVAVHLLVLYGVLNQGVAPDQALWIRRRATRPLFGPKHGRFHWLAPPDVAGCLTIADIVHAPTPAARAAQGEAFVEQVWALWAAQHRATLAQWYAAYVV